MATITLNIPDAILPRVLNGFASRYGYTPTLVDGNGADYQNPETKAQFAKRMLVDYMRTVVREAEATAAADAARQAAEQAARSEITIT